MIDASISIRDLNKWLKWNVPENGYQTLAGFVLTLFGRLPEINEEVTWEIFCFRVEKMFENALITIRVSRTQEPESSST